jgi:hypothetical protein
LQRAFPLDVLIVSSLELSFIANGCNSTGVGLASGETICFDSLEFTTDCLGHLNLSPQEGDTGALFIEMVHSGSPYSRIPSTKVELLGAKGEAPVPWPPRVQRGNPECPHHHHTSAGEHPNAPDRPDGHGVDRRAIARYGAPPQPAAGQPGGVASVNPCSVG